MTKYITHEDGQEVIPIVKAEDFVDRRGLYTLCMTDGSFVQVSNTFEAEKTTSDIISVSDALQSVAMCNSSASSSSEVLEHHMYNTTSSTTTSSGTISDVLIREITKCDVKIDDLYVEETGIPFHWSIDETHLLIRLIKENYDHLLLSYMKKKRVWIQIAAKMLQLMQSRLTWEQCDSKWKHLKTAYKNILFNNYKNGLGRRKTWEFFDEIHEFMSKTPEMRPYVKLRPQIQMKQPKFVRSGFIALSRKPGFKRRIKELNDDESEDSNDYCAANASLHLPPPVFKRAKMGQKNQENAKGILDMRHKENLERKDRFLDLLGKLIDKM